MMGGGTGPIPKALSERRSHRRQWHMFERIAMIILDAALVVIAFQLAYYLRYTVFFGNNLLTTFRNNLLGIDNAHPLKTTDIYAPISNFRPLEIGIVIGLIVIFALRGLYGIRLTGSLFRQIWTVASSTTLGLAFLVTYFFVFW